MAKVVVVGAGVGGMAVAARLAKLGHQVTLCEQRTSLGGAMHFVEQDGFRWDAGPASTTIPAVLRDLFRKSGRPIERYVDLRMRDPSRRHVFPDRSYVDLPASSRSGQTDALDAALGAGSGQAWTAFVDRQEPVWDVLRLQVLDEPYGGNRFGDREVARALSARTSLQRLLKKAFTDERLRTIAAHPFLLAGSEPRDVPAYAAVDAYVERTFGVWSVAEGLSVVADALTTRLAERGVEVLLECRVTAITVENDRVKGVRTQAGMEIPADVVITDIDPRAVFSSLVDHQSAESVRTVFERATPALPPAVTHLGIEGPVPTLPHEVVLHGDPMLVLHTSRVAAPVPTSPLPSASATADPSGSPVGELHAWTVWRRGAALEDVLMTLARRGIDVRTQVVTRLDRSAVKVIEETGGSAYGLAWAGWRENARRAAASNPLVGLHLLGASMHPGPGVSAVAWGAANVAARIGKA
ncbi:MAG: phytoene desaturase family protein [Nocardioidaceae bacterium]